MTLAPGTRLGPYEILSPLGAGGMGEVFRARDTRLGREVAVKVLPDCLASDPKALHRFETEAKAVAALSHPNVLALLDVGETNDLHFAVTELLEGEPLRALVARGPVPVKRALEITHEMAEGLAAAHAKRIVHRDVKPENVFLTRDGHVKVLDFGLAHQETTFHDPNDTHSPTVSALTEAGAVLGTVAYMSPEQASGKPVDHRSDQFSLGTVLYEMLSGKRPFRGATAAETLTAIIREEPEPLETLAKGVPVPVRWIIERCLAKDPDGRYDSTRDLARDLARETASSQTNRSQVGSGARPAALPSAPRRFALRAASAVGLVVVGAALGLLASRHASRPAGQGTSRPSFSLLANLPHPIPRPSLSPDGRTLLYESEKTPGDRDVFSLRVGGSIPVNLTSDHAGYDGEAAFSPDGNRIAFRSEREGGGLWVMGATGESPRRLAAFGHDPAWHPDGRRIVLSTATVAYPDHVFGHGALWTVDAVSGATVKAWDATDAREPSVSPDGLHIAFWSIDEMGVVTIPFSGENQPRKKVVVGRLARRPWSPLWSGDGRALLFGGNLDGTWNLWRARVDDRSGEGLGEPEPMALPSTTAGPFSLSADGRRLVFATYLLESVLERIPARVSREAGANAVPTLHRGEMGTSVSESPAGDLLAFAAPGPVGGDDVWVVRPDGTGLRRLTDDGRGSRYPHFSADGRRVYHQSIRGDSVSKIWSVGVDGSDLREELRHPAKGLLQPFPSPDGRTVAVFTMGEGPRLVRLPHPKDAPLPQPLPAPDDETFFWPWSWSPDGLRIAGTASPRREGTEGDRLLLYDVRERRYTPLPGRGSFPCFTSDGQRIVFCDGTAVRELDLPTGATRVLHTAPAGSLVHLAGVSNDGRSLYVCRTSERSEIWLAEYPGASKSGR